MSFAISTPEPSDSPDLQLIRGIAAVHNTGWREAYGTQLPARFYDDTALARRIEMWTRVLSTPDACFRTRVAVTADAAAQPEVLGFAIAGPSRDADYVGTELSAIYVRAAHYGTGVGQALLDAALGGQPAMLWVAEDNRRARAFYTRNGFSPDGQRKVDEQLGGLAEIRMTRQRG
ncbi:GNAT family N-acetyltransferase [Brevibacterium otitidis]|uniref:GNAT family N-acetyltransferase n=1 Tax=Brevibacterium otitidis TaxID=53364 RepID=A0ABV5WZH8_9MICO|nr:GNAT family N-acetyltransferase [Brevibacterium otitidis]